MAVSKVLPLLLVAAGFAFSGEVNQLGSNKVGKPFPDHTGFDVMHPKDDLVSPLEMLKGRSVKYVFLSFFQTTCGNCVTEINQLQAQKARLHQKGIEVLLVGVKEEPAALRHMVQQHKWDFPVIADRFDGDYSHQCGVFDKKEELILPTAVLLSRSPKGTMVLDAAWQGGEQDIVGQILEKAK